MEDLFETVLTVHVGLTAIISGGVQEAIKRSIMGLDKDKKFHGGPWFSTFQAFFPLLLGAGVGHLIIPDEGSAADPWILGVLAGLFSSQVYNMVKPTISSLLASRAASDE